MSGVRPGASRLASIVVVFVALGTTACAKVGPPPGVPTVVVPVSAVAGSPIEVGSSGRPAPHVALDGRSAGDPVDVEWHGSWYPAVLLERRSEGWLVRYEGWDESYDEVATPSRIRDRSIPIEEEPPDDDPDSSSP